MQQIVAVRADRAAAVRVRARPRPRHPAAGRARALLGHRAAGVRCSRCRVSFGDRGRQRRARRPAAVRPRRPGAVPRARPRPSRCSCWRSRWCWRLRRGASTGSSSTRWSRWSWRPWPRPWAWRPPVPSTACSLRVCGCARPWCRCCCCRWWRRCCSGPPEPGKRRSTAYRRTRGPGSALLGGVRPAVHGDRDAGLRAAPGGSMKTDELLKPQVSKVLGWLDARVAGRARAVRALGRAARRGPGRRATSHVPARARGVGRVPRVRRHRDLVGALAVAAHACRRSGTASPARRPSSA